MLILLVISVFASVSFYNKAKQLKVGRVRPSVFPLLAAVVVLLLGTAGAYLLTFLFTATGTSPGVQKAIAFGLDLFLLAAYFMLLKRNWNAF